MGLIKKEIIIFISAFILCFISHITNSYNAMILYLLVRIWIEMLIERSR